MSVWLPADWMPDVAAVAAAKGVTMSRLVRDRIADELGVRLPT